MPARFPNGTITVVGATGVVGRELLAVLAERGVSVDSICALASTSSAGRDIPYGSTSLTVRSVDKDAFKNSRVVFFAAGKSESSQLAPIAVESGAFVVDTSSAFRSHDDVPLVIPEINGHLVKNASLVASPNCSATLLLVALEPLRRRFGIKAINVATYQAVSGAGADAMRTLLDQTRDMLSDQPPRPGKFPEPAAFNVFSHESPNDPVTGLNEEEQKIIDESRQIWSDPDIQISPTCLRVPVLRAHTQAVTITLTRAAAENDIRQAIEKAAGIACIDERVAGRYPTPQKATGCDDILVGRLRPDPAESSGDALHRRWCLLIAGDQLRKGAALNAVQIIEQKGVIPQQR